MRLLDIIKQTVWGRMAAMNFILGGTAAGAYLLLLWFGYAAEPLAGVPAALWKVVAVLPACLGFAGILCESPRPLNGIYLLNRLRTSWMSREVLAGMIFIAAAVADAFFPQMGLRVVAASAAVGLIVTQGFMLYAARAVPSWNKALVPLLGVVSAFASGFGFLLLTSAWFDAGFARKTWPTGLAVLVLNLGVWLAYLYHSSERDFRRATRELRTPAAWVLVAVIGHGVPALWLSALALGASGGGPFAGSAAGLLVWSGAAYQKAALVLKCSYLNGLSWSEAHGEAARPQTSTPPH